MRWLAALLVVVSSQAADARPARPPRFDKDDFTKQLPKPCPRTNSWTKYASCELKYAQQLQLVHDLPAAKLIAYTENGDRTARRRVELHVMHDGGWVRTAFSGETNQNSEIVKFAAVTTDTFRIDIGYATLSWVTLDDVSSQPAMVRRQYAHFCSVTSGCRSVNVSCDVLVHGRAVSTFRAVAKLEGNKLELVGDGRATNRYCVKPPNLIEASR